jgi:acetyltransferase-like isoleucine patch superfamily enzyme
MAFLPLRKIREPEVTGIARDWIEKLRAELAQPACDRALLCRQALVELSYPQHRGNWETAVSDPDLPIASRLALASCDPRNVTLEPEYYGDLDPEKYYPVKPLLWLWEMFDKSPLGRVLAPHIFRKCGENFKCFQHTEFSFGYNMEVGDNVVVHRHVLLDDRGGITLGNRVSISDYANIYSHTHSIVEQRDVTNARTVIEDDVRITYHATVLAGVHVATNGMVGAMALATKDVRPYHVYVGIPAKSVRVKPNAPQTDEILKTSRERRDS